jgi:flagellar biosynthesis protein FlhG
VVIIDENGGPGNALSTFGVTSRYDLMDLVEGGRSAQQVMLPAAPMVRALAASRFADAPQPLDAISSERLNAGLRQIQQDAAFVLIDCAPRRGGQVSGLALAARHIAVVVAAQGSAITHAYALIKRLAREQERTAFQVVITRARSEDEAQAIFDNLRDTAREHLGVRLDYLGGVPRAPDRPSGRRIAKSASARPRERSMAADSVLWRRAQVAAPERTGACAEAPGIGGIVNPS